MGLNKVSDSLHNILMSTIGKGDKEDRFYRFIRGHVPELDFVTEYRGKGRILDGGKFMYSRDENQHQKAIYCTFTSLDIDYYIELYKLLHKKLEYVNDFFIIQNDSKVWECDLETIEIPVRSEWHKLDKVNLKKVWRDTLSCRPSRKKYGNRNGGYPTIEDMKMQLVRNSNLPFKGMESKDLKLDVLEPKYKVFKLDKDVFIESNLGEIRALFEERTPKIQPFRPYGPIKDFYSHLELNIFWRHYASEFFYRISLRGLKCEISDFDCIIDDGEGKFSFIEIKQKDPDGKTNNSTAEVDNDNNNWTLGIEMRRLLWWLKIREKIGNEHRYIYAIRELDNIQNRNPIGWKYTLVEKFRNQIIVGSERNGACMAPYRIFNDYNYSFDHL
tara:strand:+ start:163 stop:1320 length:1158 start_codon:yes stop_codon:yes gene_type:complete